MRVHRVPALDGILRERGAAQCQAVRQPLVDTMGLIATISFVGVLAQLLGPAPPGDFAVRIVFGQCWNDSVDTRRQVFTRRILPEDVRTVRIQLSEEQRTQLYQAISAVNLFDYPEQFTPPLSTMTEPASEYEIEVQSEGRRHMVRWQDYGSSAPEANRLRDLLIALHGIFTALPAVKRLPPSRIICL